MKYKGWRQPELEEASGVDQSMISKLLNGQAPNVSARILIELADALGVRAGWLIADGGERIPNPIRRGAEAETPVPSSSLRPSRAK